MLFAPKFRDTARLSGENSPCMAQTSLHQHLAAIAIVFDFVNPVLSLWRLIDQGWKLWLDESEPGGYTKHWDLAEGIRPGTVDRGTVFY